MVTGKDYKKILLLALNSVSSLAAWAASNSGGQQPLLPTTGSNDYPRLNFSASAPLIFHSTFALLQQWPNTFYPNGHIVAPCTIPKSINLYHAHQNGSFPESPEWFAFDASMAYAILGAGGDSHLLTFRTMQDVKCLYFDGESASLNQPGSLDSQMLVIHNSSSHVPEDPRFGFPRPPADNHTGPPSHGYGRPPSGFNPLRAEYERAAGLCNFIEEKNLGGPGWGYEGIVRMNAAFELIWCNFTSPSAQLISWFNVSAPRIEGIPDPRMADITLEDEVPPRPPRKGGPGWRWSDREQPFRPRSAYEWFLSATKTFGFKAGMPGRGEARVKIDSCGLFTFYDEALQDQSRVRVEAERDALNLTTEGFWQPLNIGEDRQVALQKLARRRRTQRATNVSSADGQYMRSEIEHRMRHTLLPTIEQCSDIDWILIAQTIVAGYSADLYELKSLLGDMPTFQNSTFVRNWLSSIRGLAHHLYMPYYQYPPSVLESLEHSLSPSHPFSLTALERCKSQHASEHSILSRSERTTYGAITEILSGICTITLPIFLSTELLWLSNFNNASHILANLNETSITSTTTHILHNLEELMAWLGWEEQWVTCSPACDISKNQICTVPIWPVMGSGHMSGPGGNGGRNRWGPQGSEEWLEARCVDAEHVL